MLKILDLYIIKKLLLAYFFVIVVIIMVIFSIDYTEKIEDFTRNNLTSAEILNWYKTLVPYYVNLFTPILTFIAVLFITMRLAVHSEIIAMLSSGIKFVRIMRPYVIGAVLIGLLNFNLIGWTIPILNIERIDFLNKYVDNVDLSENDVHIQQSEGVFLYLQNFSDYSNIGYKFRMEKFEGTEMVSVLTANRILWDSATEKWTLEDWKRRDFDSLSERVTTGAKIDTTIVIKPDDFESDYKKWEMLTMPQLSEKITNMRQRGRPGVKEFIVERYFRYTSPFSVIVLAMLALIASSRKTRGGAGYALVLGFVFAFSFIIMAMFMRSVAVNSDWPLIPLWTPNILYAGIAYVFYKRSPR